MSQTAKIVLISAIVGLAAAFIGVKSFVPSGVVTEVKQQESAYERVMRTGVLRCGYFLEHPVTVKDPNTGDFKGIVPDLVQALADDIGLNVEWTEEINAATMVEGLNTGRYDALCAGIMVLSSRAHLMEHSVSFLYTPLNAYVRADDNRFDNNIMAANDAQYTIIGLDGSGKTLLAEKLFSKSNINVVPQFSSFSELFVNVASKKGDMTFTAPSEFRQYNKFNPGVLKDVGIFTLIPYAFTYRQGEVELKNMIDTVFMTYAADGRLKNIINKWVESPEDFYHVNLPYKK